MLQITLIIIGIFLIGMFALGALILAVEMAIEVGRMVRGAAQAVKGRLS